MYGGLTAAYNLPDERHPSGGSFSFSMPAPVPGLTALEHEWFETAAADHLGSRPLDVRPARVGVLPREDEGSSPHLSGLGETSRSTKQCRDSRRDPDVCPDARGAAAHAESPRYA